MFTRYRPDTPTRKKSIDTRLRITSISYQELIRRIPKSHLKLSTYHVTKGITYKNTEDSLSSSSVQKSQCRCLDPNIGY
jgi:hypothetical protein